MGWLRLVGSLKLQVSFAEYRLLYRALLQKRLIILRSLPIVTTSSHNAAGFMWQSLQRMSESCHTLMRHVARALQHTSSQTLKE